MPPRHLTSSQSDDARMEAGASLELMNNTRECTSKLSQTGNNNRQSTIPIKPREPSARCQEIFIFPLPLRATAHIPELKVKKNTKSYTPGEKKTPIAAYPTLRPMLVRTRCISCERGDDTKSAANFPQRKDASFCMSETCCKCPQTSSPKETPPRTPRE
jgi:hypothetical protein